MGKIVLENLRKDFGKFTAVRDLNLEIEDGEFAAILGPSGCGKSTTMNMISGIEYPTAGKVYIDGRCVNDVTPGKRNIGFVFQNYAIFTHMSVYDNLAYGLRIQKRAKEEIDPEVRRVAKLMQLEEYLHANAGGLSVNRMQQLALGRSMIVKPNIFLLDEPLSNLDAAFRAIMRAELKKLQKELSQTMIYVTHDQIEAMSMADRIAVMTAGELQQYDTPDAIYNQPKNLFVAGFIGSPQMNFVDCSIKEEAGRLLLTNDVFKVDVTEFRSNIANRSNGSEVVFGIRPESIEVGESRISDHSLEATVNLVETLGSKTIAHLKIGRDMIRASMPPTFRLRVGEKRWATFNLQNIHVFDRRTEVAII